MEAVIVCGIQRAGKSTFVRERFFDTHVRISRDLLRTPNRERRFLETCLDTRQPFVVDKVNATRAERAPYVQAARAAGFRAVAYWLDVRPADALARNAGRAGRAVIPVPAILGTYKRLEVPSLEEGFDEVWRVEARTGAFVVTPLPEGFASEAQRGRRGADAPRLRGPRAEVRVDAPAQRRTSTGERRSRDG